MAAINFYAGLQRGLPRMNPDMVVNGTSSAGMAVDVEVRMQIDNGSGPTGIQRKDVIILLKEIILYIERGGLNGSGANLPNM